MQTLNPAQYNFIEKEHKERVEKYVNNLLSEFTEWRDMRERLSNLLEKNIDAAEHRDGNEMDSIIGMLDDMVYDKIYAAYCKGFSDALNDSTV